MGDVTRDNGPSPRNSISAFGIPALGVAVMMGMRFKGAVGVAVNKSVAVGEAVMIVPGVEVGGAEVGKISTGWPVATGGWSTSAVRKMAVGR
jgi:hypothetical protein